MRVLIVELKKLQPQKRRTFYTLQRKRGISEREKEVKNDYEKSDHGIGNTAYCPGFPIQEKFQLRYNHDKC